MKNSLVALTVLLLSSPVSAMILNLNTEMAEEKTSGKAYNEVELSKNKSVEFLGLSSNGKFIIKADKNGTKGSCTFKLFDKLGNVVKTHRGSFKDANCTVELKTNPLEPETRSKSPISNKWNVTPTNFSAGKIEIALSGEMDSTKVRIDKVENSQSESSYSSRLSGNGSFDLSVEFSTDH